MITSGATVLSSSLAPHSLGPQPSLAGRAGGNSSAEHGSPDGADTADQHPYHTSSAHFAVPKLLGLHIVTLAFSCKQVYAPIESYTSSPQCPPLGPSPFAVIATVRAPNVLPHLLQAELPFQSPRGVLNIPPPLDALLSPPQSIAGTFLCWTTTHSCHCPEQPHWGGEPLSFPLRPQPLALPLQAVVAALRSQALKPDSQPTPGSHRLTRELSQVASSSDAGRGSHPGEDTSMEDPTSVVALLNVAGMQRGTGGGRGVLGRGWERTARIHVSCIGLGREKAQQHCTRLCCVDCAVVLLLDLSKATAQAAFNAFHKA